MLYVCVGMYVGMYVHISILTLLTVGRSFYFRFPRKVTPPRKILSATAKMFYEAFNIKE